jgi:hypothetical protein
VDVAPPNWAGMAVDVALFLALFAVARYFGDLPGRRES